MHFLVGDFAGRSTTMSGGRWPAMGRRPLSTRGPSPASGFVDRVFDFDEVRETADLLFEFLYRSVFRGFPSFLE